MTTSEIATAVREYLETNLLYMRPGFSLGDTTRLLEERVVDSIGVMEVIAFLEDRFAIAIRDDEVTEANLGSIAAMARFVATKLGQVRAA